MRRLVFAGIGAWTFAFAACPARAGEPNVTVTLKPVHALVARVMTGVGTPHLIVDGAASPHTFTLKPSSAAAISNADVFIRVSGDLEPFTRKVVEALPDTVKLVSLAEAPGVTLLNQRRGGTFEQHDHHDAGPDEHDEAEDASGVKDGHIWLDPENAKAILVHAGKVLSEKYPDHAQVFEGNVAAAAAEIDAMSRDIDGQLAAYKTKPFIVFHDATQYFERRFGLAAAGSITVTPDVQPSAKRLTAIRAKIASLGAVCVFAEPGFQPALVAAVTDGSKARSGTLDPEGLTLQAGPQLYFELMRGMAAGIKACLAAAD